jgi:hypothetical protein
MVSTTFGRPTAINEKLSRVSLPSPGYDSRAVPAHADQIHFFNATISLYRIMSATLELLYHNPAHHSDADFSTSTAVLDLEKRLKNWSMGLNPSLRHPYHEGELDQYPWLKRQNKVLYARYLTLSLS